MSLKAKGFMSSSALFLKGRGASVTNSAPGFRHIVDSKVKWAKLSKYSQPNIHVTNAKAK